MEINSRPTLYVQIRLLAHVAWNMEPERSKTCSNIGAAFPRNPAWCHSWSALFASVHCDHILAIMISRYQTASKLAESSDKWHPRHMPFLVVYICSYPWENGPHFPALKMLYFERSAGLQNNGFDDGELSDCCLFCQRYCLARVLHRSVGSKPSNCHPVWVGDDEERVAWFCS